jgi:D-inositol-3-phosphate glycosyltransferase
MKILMYGESPVIATGLAQVTRTIVDALVADGHQIEIVAMNHHGVVSYDRSVFPYEVVPLIDQEDANAFDTIIDRVKNSDYDCLIVSTDFGRDDPVFDALGEKDKLVVGYYAVDCDTLNPQTFNNLVHCNVKTTYTQHGKRVIEKYRPDMDGLISIIPLACEPDVFYPLSLEERRIARQEIFRTDDDDKFIIVNVNRNQPRKDLGRTLMIFHEFHQKHPNSLLYMHCQQNDVAGHLPTMCEMLGMELGKEVLFTQENFKVLQGYTREYLNRVYNAVDCFMSTSLGEGWGLATTESMAAGCPVVVPNNTAFTEIVGANEERGYLAKSGGDIDHQVWLYKMTNHPHDVVHADSMLEKLERVYSNRGEAREKARLARQWTLQNTKKEVGERWKELFRVLEQARAKEVSYVR